MQISKVLLDKIITEEILKIFEEINSDESPIDPSIAKKTINDEFEVSEYALDNIKKSIEKANKRLRARNMKELELKILGTRMHVYTPPKAQMQDNEPEPIKVPVFKIKIIGDVPDIHDYEFIAKVEHTEAGNIINMNPNIPPEKLPAEYRTYSQKCDICHTNRERNNTFIIKKLENGQLICAGSTCLKKFMPLDAVKAFLEYAVQLESMRNLLVNAEATIEDDYNERDGSGGVGRSKRYYDPEEFLVQICVAYLSAGKRYVSKANAEKWNTSTTLQTANYLYSQSYGRHADEEEREKAETIRKYKPEAESIAKNILEWIKEQDFDQMALDNPNMENYFNNMKVLANLPYIPVKNVGYYASFLALYLRDQRQKNPVAQSVKKESEYVGTIGQKLTTKVKVKSSKSFQSNYGYTYIYNLEDESGNKLVWFSSNEIDAFEESKGSDTLFNIIGTVKAQQVSKYNNQKETIITRVKVL